MENEKNRNYLDERRSSGENNPPNLDPENEIKSGPKKELLGSSNEIKEPKNENNEVIEMMKKKNNKDLTIPIILGVVFLMIIIIVAGFYFLKDKDIPTIGGVGPQQKILNSSLMAMNDVESYSFEGDVNVSFTGDDEEGFSLAMKFDGQADGSDTDNIKSSFNVKPEIAISKEGGSEDISFDFSMKSFGKIGEETAYLKLNDFDLGMAGMMYGEMIVPYKDKWYFLDMKELREESGFPLEENDFDFKKIMEDIKDLSKKYEMIKFQKDLGDTKLGDVDVYHYQIEIDSEEAFDFYVELLKTIVPKIDPVVDFEDFDAEVEESKGEILAMANEVLANVKTEIWIGKDDKMIYRIDLRGDYNEEDINRITNKSLGTARAKANDARIKSEIQQVVTDLVIYGDDNYDGVDVNFEGYNLDDSKIFISHNSKINVRTSKDAYVVWSELAATTDKWCVDSNNETGYILGDIEGIQCSNVSKTPQGEKKSDTEIESESESVGNDIDAELSFSISMTMSNFNQPIIISKPEESEDLMKTLEWVMTGMMGGMMTSDSTWGDDFDQDRLSNQAEEFYGTDPNNPDTDGDGHNDGDEVSRGYDPLLPGEAKLDYDRLFSK